MNNHEFPVKYWDPATVLTLDNKKPGRPPKSDVNSRKMVEYKELKELMQMEVQDQEWSGLLSVEEAIISLK